MILFLLAPLTPDKIREFGDFTLVNPAKFDRLRKALKSLKSQFFYGWVGSLGIDWLHKFGSAVGIRAFGNSGTEFFPAIRAVFHT
jgi:hypothetical protein